MHRYKTIIFLLFFVYSQISSQIYKTEPLSKEINTLQVNANGNWYDYPVIELNSDNFIQINFDRISSNSNERLRYKIVHCNADWSVSSLSDIEYLNGFNDNLIFDNASSMRTTIHYTNFIFNIPNRDVTPRLSGNYAVLVYPERNPSDILLSACFSIVEPLVKINAAVSSITNIDANREHQQVSFSFDHNNIRVFNPQAEIKAQVRQNNNIYNQKDDIRATFIRGTRLVYENNRDLIFEAGNEYRRFESVSHRFNGLNIERTLFENPVYITYIRPDRIRSLSPYSYDQDQNGRFLIRNSETNEDFYDTEADYFITNFTLLSEKLPYDIFVNGDFTYNTFSDKFKMKYSEESKAYYLSLMLKQGAYNYQYLTKPKDTFSPALIEGNHFETENEYTIYIYHRAQGQRYDSLIGYQKIRTR